MTCPFRYVDETSDTSVNLHLFRTLNGTPRGDVKGPVGRHYDGLGNEFARESCLPLNRAFAVAVRMANSSDSEIVVSGDRQLWDPSWGNLAALS
ncbi:MAG TPA: hypothetical protein VL147_12470 [Devosia sp.]|jgi:hypothetical protein|nr:hypothetical protein [Devosia sp.]